MVKVSNRILSARPLMIKQIALETNKLIASGANIISLSQGTPNLPIFEEAKTSMMEFINKGTLPYTDVMGTQECREAAAKFVNHYYFPHSVSPPFTPSHVIATAGAAQSVFNALALSVESADDVVISPLPSYGLYSHQTQVLGGTFAAVETKKENSFVPSIEEFRAAFRRFTVSENVGGTVVERNRIRSVILCYPNNPTGSLLSPSQVKDFALFFEEQLAKFPNPGFSVILDEPYIGIENGHHSLLTYAASDPSCASLLNSLILVLSCSKGLGAMPGARAGWLTCHNTLLVQEMVKVQMACTANPSSVSQKGLAASLDFLRENGSEMKRIYGYYMERVRYAAKRMDEMGKQYFGKSLVLNWNSDTDTESDSDRLSTHSTFYLMCDFSCFPRVETDIGIQEMLRDEYKNGEMKTGVAVVPGSAFSLNPADKLIRIACAVDMDKMITAMNVIEKCIRRMIGKT